MISLSDFLNKHGEEDRPNVSDVPNMLEIPSMPAMVAMLFKELITAGVSDFLVYWRRFLTIGAVS